MKMRTRFGRSGVAKFSCAWALNQRRINNGRKNLFIGWASTNDFQNNGNNVLVLNSSKIRIERLSLVFITLLPAASHEFLFKCTDHRVDQIEVAGLVFRQLPMKSEMPQLIQFFPIDGRYSEPIHLEICRVHL